MIRATAPNFFRNFLYEPEFRQGQTLSSPYLNNKTTLVERKHCSPLINLITLLKAHRYTGEELSNGFAECLCLSLIR
jgi:hypothetical protein